MEHGFRPLKAGEIHPNALKPCRAALRGSGGFAPSKALFLKCCTRSPTVRVSLYLLFGPAMEPVFSAVAQPVQTVECIFANVKGDDRPLATEAQFVSVRPTFALPCVPFAAVPVTFYSVSLGEFPRPCSSECHRQRARFITELFCGPTGAWQ